MTDFCPDCGAYWPCEHRRTPEDDGLEYVAPDSLRWIDVHGPAWQEQEQADWVTAFEPILDVLAQIVTVVADGVQPMCAAIEESDRASVVLGTPVPQRDLLWPRDAIYADAPVVPRKARAPPGTVA